MNNNRAIILGANGQDGYYLTELLQNKGFDVTGISRNGIGTHLDIKDYQAVAEIIKLNQPEYIFDFAANSTTNHNALFENHDTICTGTLNVLEAVKKNSPRSKVFLSGSGLQFVNKGIPIKETDEFDANSAYSVCRIQSVYAGRYFRSLGLKVYFGYFFNHESPLRPPRHMSKKIALLARAAAAGKPEKIEIGAISVKKEWAFAGDIVNGIFALVNQDSVFEATIGTGQAYSIEQWLEVCFGLINKDWRQHTVLGKDFTPEYQILVSNPATINALGWRPTINFELLAKMMVLDK